MKNLAYYLFLYLYLYVPVINGPIRKIIISIYFFVALYVMHKYKRFLVGALQELKPITYSIIYLTVFVIANTMINGADPIILTATFSMVITPYISALSFIGLYKAKKRKNLISDLFTVSIVASMISLILYFVPPLGEYFQLLQAGDDFKSLTRFYEDGRGYGIAGSLFFGFSIIQSIIIFLVLKYVNGYKKFFYIAIIFFSIILNARIGLFLLVALFSVNYILLSSFKQVCKMLIGITIIIIIFVKVGLYNYFSHNIDWMMEGFYMTSDFLLNTNFGPEGGHFSGLAGYFIVWPQGIFEWLTGSGIYLLYGSNRGSSDIGLILQLNWGGLIYVFLLITPYIYMIKKSFQAQNYILFLIIILSIIIGNWKGDLFMQSNFIFITTILFYIRICKNEKIINNHGRI